MANQPVDLVALMHHKIIQLRADNLIFPRQSKGGVVTFTSSLETPDDVKMLKVSDSFSILLTLECKASDGENEEPAFIASCKAEGTFYVAQCSKDEISAVGNNALWNTAASQLMPLISNFVAEQIIRMGFKNIQVPPYFPVAVEAISTKPKPVSKSKPNKTKSIRG